MWMMRPPAASFQCFTDSSPQTALPLTHCDSRSWSSQRPIRTPGIGPDFKCMEEELYDKGCRAFHSVFPRLRIAPGRMLRAQHCRFAASATGYVAHEIDHRGALDRAMRGRP